MPCRKTSLTPTRSWRRLVYRSSSWSSTKRPPPCRSTASSACPTWSSTERSGRARCLELRHTVGDCLLLGVAVALANRWRVRLRVALEARGRLSADALEHRTQLCLTDAELCHLLAPCLARVERPAAQRGGARAELVAQRERCRGRRRRCGRRRRRRRLGWRFGGERRRRLGDGRGVGRRCFGLAGGVASAGGQ